ncbi:hypothetical protein [Paraburkholderia unamae]|uniref:hypothetical protein n=1 Tax=Paraburkholderia unamae TaxID=219649 RepID=UPI001AD7FDE9|nr:hypothetical protein [Paraburkholderia unamae]
MTAPVQTFVLTRRRKQKTRLVGRVVVAAAKRALTHHSLNGANNQRNREKAAVHLVKNDLALWACQLPESGWPKRTTTYVLFNTIYSERQRAQAKRHKKRVSTLIRALVIVKHSRKRNITY